MRGRGSKRIQVSRERPRAGSPPCGGVDRNWNDAQGGECSERSPPCGGVDRNMPCIRRRASRPRRPRAGAWIETPPPLPLPPKGEVAPRAGAWIETSSGHALQRSRLGDVDAKPVDDEPERDEGGEHGSSLPTRDKMRLTPLTRRNRRSPAPHRQRGDEPGGPRRVARGAEGGTPTDALAGLRRSPGPGAGGGSACRRGRRSPRASRPRLRGSERR